MMLRFLQTVLHRGAFAVGLIGWGVACLAALVAVVVLSPFILMGTILKEETRGVESNRHR